MTDKTDARPDDQLTWEMYKTLGEECQHFNTLESGYRVLASTWLLAAFAGIGFILTESLTYKSLLILAVGAAGAVGIFLLWLLDLMVYHRLLGAAFAEQLRLERDFPWLPQAAHGMMKAHGGRGVLPKVIWFYVMTYLALSGIASVALGQALVTVAPLPIRILISLAAFVVGGILVGMYMYFAGTGPTGEQPR